jgi:hypothetical protein
LRVTRNVLPANQVSESVNGLGMKFIKGLLAGIGTLITGVLGGAVAAGIYRRLKYPNVPVEETDVFFDIGLVFFLGFFAVLVTVAMIWVVHYRWRAGRGLLLRIMIGMAIMVLWCFLLLEAARRFPIYFIGGTALLVAGWCFFQHSLKKRDMQRGWRARDVGPEELCYEEWREGAWQPIQIPGEMLLDHHVIYLARLELPDWAKERRDEIVGRIKSAFRSPDYEYDE